MRKKGIIFFVSILSITLFSSCSCSGNKNVTISIDRNEITLNPGQGAYIIYSTSNNSKVNDVKSDKSNLYVDYSTTALKNNNYVYILPTKEGTYNVTLGNSNITNYAKLKINCVDNCDVIKDKIYKDYWEMSQAIDFSFANGNRSIAITSNHKFLDTNEESNNSNEYSFEYFLALYSEFYSTSMILSSYGNDKISGGYTNYFVFDDTSNVAASKFVDSPKKFTKLLDMNYESKRNHGEASEIPIEQHKDQLESFICNTSDELFYAVEHGYYPSCVTNSIAETLYNKAKDILARIIPSDCSDYDKMQLIFGWITNNTYYNYYEVPDDGLLGFTYTNYYLEGPLIHGTGVCDSFSKTFALFAGMEFININKDDRTPNVVRAYGYSNQGGHAWNYVDFNNSDTYYLTCPTWAMDHLSSEKTKYFSYTVEFTNYSAFLTTKDYFNVIEQITFTDASWPTITKSESIYNNPDNTYGYLKNNEQSITDYVSNFKNYYDNKDFSFCAIASDDYTKIGEMLEKAIKANFPQSSYALFVTSIKIDNVTTDIIIGLVNVL